MLGWFDWSGQAGSQPVTLNERRDLIRHLAGWHARRCERSIQDRKLGCLDRWISRAISCHMIFGASQDADASGCRTPPGFFRVDPKRACQASTKCPSMGRSPRSDCSSSTPLTSSSSRRTGQPDGRYIIYTQTCLISKAAGRSGGCRCLWELKPFRVFGQSMSFMHYAGWVSPDGPRSRKPARDRAPSR